MGGKTKRRWVRAKWGALMNFLIKSEQHRATTRYYYLSHRSIRRTAVVHDDLQITSKQLCAGTSPADIYLYRCSIVTKQKKKEKKAKVQRNEGTRGEGRRGGRGGEVGTGFAKRSRFLIGIGKGENSEDKAPYSHCALPR